MKTVVVLTSGVFDLLHYGHVLFLEEAKKIGGKKSKLIVVVARDSTVKQLKGKEPIIPEDQRRALVEALKPVDEAILGYADLNIVNVLKKIKPDIVTLGYDQDYVEKAVRKAVLNSGLNIKLVKIPEFPASDLNSSSKIKRKIIKEWK